MHNLGKGIIINDATLAIAYYLRDIRDKLTEINLKLKHIE